MTKFSIQRKPHDKMQPPKKIELRLSISQHESDAEGFPTLTHWCATEAEVEAKFNKIIVAVQKKKSEALAILKKSRNAHSDRP